jgi:hypothetical protein
MPTLQWQVKLGSEALIAHDTCWRLARLAGIGALAAQSVMDELRVMADRWLHGALQVASACSSKDVWVTTMSVLTALDAGVSRCSVVGVVGTEPVDTLAERLKERMPVNLSTGTDKVPLGLIH